jgi:MFS family permease
LLGSDHYKLSSSFPGLSLVALCSIDMAQRYRFPLPAETFTFCHADGLAQIMRIPALLYVLSVMMTSICTELWHFILAQGVLGGLGLGMTMAPAMAAVGQYFHKKRGAAMGLGVAGSSLGGVILPIALDKLLHQPGLSFGWSVRIMGFIILALLAPSCLFIKARLPPRRTSFFLPRAFKEPAYSTLVACCFFLMMGLFPPMFFLPSYAIDQGMGSDLAFYLVAILNSASFPGRIIPGLLADRFGRLNMLFFAGLSTGILSLCWQACHSNAAILVYTALFGFCSGAIISGQVVALTIVPQDPRNIGTYLGMGMGVAAFATLVGPPASGAMVSHYHSYTAVSTFSGVVSLVGAILVIPAKLTAGHALLSKN